MPEFSRPVRLEDIGEDGVDLDLAATDKECHALARRIGVDALNALRATIAVRPMGKRLFAADGKFAADVVQTCVITLEPFESTFAEPFERRYRSGRSKQDAASGPIDIDPFADDPPDPVIDGVIDLGEAIAEELVLLVDPHPRKPGASFETQSAQEDDEADADARNNPFEVLKNWPPNDRN